MLNAFKARLDIDDFYQKTSILDVVVARKFLRSTFSSQKGHSLCLMNLSLKGNPADKTS
jgi:hypothetical protein